MPSLKKPTRMGVEQTPNPKGDHKDGNSSSCFLFSQGNSTRKLLKASSTGTMSSSDDFEERDSLQTSENGEQHRLTRWKTVLSHLPTNSFSCSNAVPAENGTSQQQFRHALLSSAAQTHRLRKLRGPTKCRECDTFMVNGFECEEVRAVITRTSCGTVG